MFGLFTMTDAADSSSVGDTGRTPYQLLTDAVAGLVADGRLPADRSDAIAITCWSTVHGFATLATRGPLREFPRAQRDALGSDLVRHLVAALLASGPLSDPAG